VKRLLGRGAGLLFKGSGFYITDYRKPGYSEAKKNESSSTTAGGAGPSKDTAAAGKSDKGVSKKD
jgi:hypothetical protein